MLDIVFGEDGVIEAEDKKSLKDKLENACILLDEIEKDETEKTPAFSDYLKQREKSVLRT